MSFQSVASSSGRRWLRGSSLLNTVQIKGFSLDVFIIPIKSEKMIINFLLILGQIPLYLLLSSTGFRIMYISSSVNTIGRYIRNRMWCLYTQRAMEECWRCASQRRRLLPVSRILDLTLNTGHSMVLIVTQSRGKVLHDVTEDECIYIFTQHIQKEPIAHLWASHDCFNGIPAN